MKRYCGACVWLLVGRLVDPELPAREVLLVGLQVLLAVREEIRTPEVVVVEVDDRPIAVVVGVEPRSDSRGAGEDILGRELTVSKRRGSGPKYAVPSSPLACLTARWPEPS